MKEVDQENFICWNISKRNVEHKFLQQLNHQTWVWILQGIDKSKWTHPFEVFELDQYTWIFDNDLKWYLLCVQGQE